MFDTLSDRLSGIFTKLRGKGRLSDADIDATAREIRLALLEADVALPVVKAFIARLKERARGAEVSQALNPAQQVIKIVHEELVGVLGGEARRLQFAKHPPTVIMLAGLQGSGKTTLAGKLARHLKGLGHQPLLVAADLQRPNAVNQLQVLGKRAGVEVFAPEPGNGGGGDPVAVSSPATRSSTPRRHMRDIVIVDTAGRLGIDAEMMAQAANIRDAVEPDEVLFVIDAMVGQDAVATAEAFRDGVGITGVVLSKLDGDARGGAALSVREVTGQPILFASTGEKLEDFDVFHPDRMASRILGMGDVLTLIEQAEAAFDEEQKERMTAKLVGGESFTLEDFLEQMTALRRMGPIANMLAMMPGMNQFKDQLAEVDDKHFDQIAAIIRGMTPGERREPEDHQRLAPGAHRQRLRRHRHGRQPAAQPLRRRAEADEADGRHDGPARDAPQGDQVAEEQAQGRQGRQPPAHRRRRCRAALPGRDAGRCRRGSTRRALESGAAGLPPGFTLPKLGLHQAHASVTTTGRQARLRSDRRVEQCGMACARARRGAARRRGAGPLAGRRPGDLRAGAGAETLADRGFILPGLVDAHCHIGIRPGGGPIESVDEARELAAVDRDAGVLAIRDAGSPYPYPELDDDPRLPRLARAGRHVAPVRRYLRDIGVEVEAADAADGHRRRRPAAGNGWVKLVGDWIDRDVGDLAPAWDLDAMAGAVAAAHAAGARVAVAHVRRGVGGGAGAGRRRLGRARHRPVRLRTSTRWPGGAPPWCPR